ncbi:MAG: hypothetical protein FJ368_03195 [Pelagibacterales bacterium]|nr:hypothetical protein [Pelagibacterales bacterium]
MKDYLQEKFDELVDEYLSENCSQVEEKAPYGDTEVTVYRGYSESDRVEAEVYAMDRLEEALLGALEDLKEENGFKPKSVGAVIEKAKETINNL